MTKKERVKAVLDMQIPDRIPVMMHNFQTCAKEAGITMAEFRSSAEKMSNAMIQACIKYDLDGILLDVDTALLASACGADVKYPEDIAAVTEDVQPRSMEQLIEDLPKVDLRRSERVQIYLDAVHRLSRWCNENDVYLRGNADQGPFSLACELTGMTQFLINLVDEDNEELIKELIGQTYRISLEMHKLCMEAGADGTSYGNSSEGCSVISPDMFREFALPYEKRLASDLNAIGSRAICHICGNVNPILEDLASTGCIAYEFDAKTDIELAQKISKGHFSISGNIDPALIYERTPDEIIPQVRKLLDLYRNKGGLIICSGCAISPNTPEENIYAIVNTVKTEG